MGILRAPKTFNISGIAAGEAGFQSFTDDDDLEEYARASLLNGVAVDNQSGRRITVQLNGDSSKTFPVPAGGQKRLVGPSFRSLKVINEGSSAMAGDGVDLTVWPQDDVDAEDFGGQASPLPNYYDRGAVKVHNESTVNPGSSSRVNTQEWAYTVPAGKKAFLEWVFLRVKNQSASALNGPAGSMLAYDEGGGTRSQIAQVELMPGEASVNEEEIVAGVGLLDTGHTLEARTSVGNNATGTNVGLTAAMMVTEFDA